MSSSESNFNRTERVLDLAATWLVPVILLGIAIAGYVILGKRENVSKKEPDLNNIPLVETVSVKEHDSTLDIHVEGKVVPHKEMILSAQVSGKITEKKDICWPGRYVKKDTVLLIIDPQDYEIEVEKAKQDLEQAKNNIKENDQEIKNTNDLITLAQEDVDLKLKSLKRMESLSGRSAISEAEMDSEKRSVIVAKNALLTLKNQSALLKVKSDRLKQAEKIAGTILEKAQLNLSRTEIKAPVSGVVVSTNVESDSLVQPGTELLRIEDTSAVEIHIQLQMKELYWLWQQSGKEKEELPSRDYEIPKSPATVSYTLEGTTFQWEGRLERFEGIGLDEKTRTVACRVIVKDPRKVTVRNQTGEKENRLTGPPALVRGMYVDVAIHVKPKTLLLSLPEVAIQPGSQVWLVEDGKLKIVPVQIAEWNKKDNIKYAILNGLNTPLNAGDLIITSPIPVFEDGMEVKVVKEKPDNQSAEVELEINQKSL